MKSSDSTENKVFFGIVFSIAVVLVYFMYSAEATFDSGDGLTHFFISKYSWKHPGLFLHHWGKPFFTLVSSPFSQFGLFGMSIFQIVCALATSYFCFRIAKKLELRFAWLLPVFICFAPIYFAVINSGLTEIFFGCILLLSIWMLFEKQFVVAAIAASLLPFVRVDAFVTVPLIALILLIRKQFVALPFLLFGFIIYSIIGYFYFDDLLWVLHQSQNFFDEGYPGMKGEIFHYLKNSHQIWGNPLSILLIAGMVCCLYRFISIRSVKTIFFLEEIILIFGSFFACLLIHTLSYCLPGVLNNLGMLRYMATLIPCVALISLIGLNFILPLFKNKNYLEPVFILAFVFFIILTPFKRNYFPFHLNNEEIVTNEAANWMKNNIMGYSKICYFPSAFPLFYEIDPFDNSKIITSINIDEELPSSWFPSSSIMVWDTHYGPQEGNVPLAKLENKKSLLLLKTFTSTDRKFEIRIYKVK